MNTLLLITIIIGVTLQNVVRKAYNNRVLGGAYSFSAGSSLFALIIFLVTSINDFNFNSTTLMYSLFFAFFYSLGAVFVLLAIGCGPLSITSLAVSYSLIIPTFYGLIMLGEESKPTLYFGIALLLISLLLINFENRDEKKKITPKWAIFTILAFIGNGGCSTVQKIQVVNQNGRYSNEFMIIAIVISAITMFIVSLVTEKKSMRTNLKKGFVFYAVCGIANGVVNLLVILLSNGRMPASVMFPLISAGGIIATFILSLFLYKEKLSKEQILGVILGTASVVFLNL